MVGGEPPLPGLKNGEGCDTMNGDESGKEGEGVDRERISGIYDSNGISL